jgi:hypothetical protein
MIETRRASRIRSSVALVGPELLERRPGDERHGIVGEMEDGQAGSRYCSDCGAHRAVSAATNPSGVSAADAEPSPQRLLIRLPLRPAPPQPGGPRR